MPCREQYQVDIAGFRTYRNSGIDPNHQEIVTSSYSDALNEGTHKSPVLSLPWKGTGIDSSSLLVEAEKKETGQIVGCYIAATSGTANS